MAKALLASLFLFLFVFAGGVVLHAEPVGLYWVFLTDKNGVNFDPQSYFDAHAVARYRSVGADLNDQSNFPLRQDYVAGVISEGVEAVGMSRWFNAVAVEASEAQAEALRQLPYVVSVRQIGGEGDAVPCDAPTAQAVASSVPELSTTDDRFAVMEGAMFADRGIDGKGVRIAVFDGGFPLVDKHECFAQLRDGGRIKKTWNFCNNKENVYLGSNHGTATLSCIAGIAPIVGEQDSTAGESRIIGLATGAEFLLARTENNFETPREEVWWTMAAEWADRNGADIISSSLGYGKDRYYPEQINGTSVVARAANMAARKGMLVCNSAGNERDDHAWLTLVTPSESDSVLCVGAMELDDGIITPTSYTSLGLNTNGAKKPNVIAPGTVNAPTDRCATCYSEVMGTSFACPTVAGFAACVKQLHPELCGVQLLHAIERSAGSYPYHDVVSGYGVPKASYFVADTVRPEPTFELSLSVSTPVSKSVEVKSLADNGDVPVYYTVRGEQDTTYRCVAVKHFDKGESFTIKIANHGENTLLVSLNGYTDSMVVVCNTGGYTFGIRVDDADDWRTTEVYCASPGLGDVAARGDCSRKRTEFYWQGGMNVLTAHEMPEFAWSLCNHLGARWMWAPKKYYCVGLAAEWSMSNYRMVANSLNVLDNYLSSRTEGLQEHYFTADDISCKKLKEGALTLELFQRLRIAAAPFLSHRGLYFDMGVYGSFDYYRYVIKGDGNKLRCNLGHGNYDNMHRFNAGVTARIGLDLLAIYGRYRLTDNTADNMLQLPRLELGLQVALP